MEKISGSLDGAAGMPHGGIPARGSAALGPAGDGVAGSGAIRQQEVPVSVELADTRPARRRERLTDAPRRRAVLVRYNDDERLAVASAAKRAGLTTTAYVATVALDIARAVPPTAAPSPLRDALAELIMTRGQLRRFGTNVNQAVAAFNATGEAPPALLTAVAVTARAVQRVDLAAAELRRRMR